MKTGSKDLIRNINNKLVLETIIANQPISRASISKILGLTKATVSAIVQELMNQHLIIEIGCDDTNLGRKPILLSFHKRAGHVICIDLGVTMISALITDLCADDCILKQIKTPSSGYEILSSLSDMIRSTLAQLPPTPYGLISITIGIHGITSNNQIGFTPYYDLSSINLKDKLEELFHVPVHIENEANLSVLGEKTFAFDYKNMANISIHSGIGLGIIMNHRLYTGHNGVAGEIGHTIIEVDGRPCPCGNHGCLEQYLSERVLLNDFAKLKHLPECSFEFLVKAYHSNDPDALYILHQFNKYMSVCVNNIVNTYNPSIIIINSRFTNTFPWLIDELLVTLHTHMQQRIQIVPSTLQDTSILLGGISVCIKQFLQIDTLTLATPNLDSFILSHSCASPREF